MTRRLRPLRDFRDRWRGAYEGGIADVTGIPPAPSLDDRQRGSPYLARLRRRIDELPAEPRDPDTCEVCGHGFKRCHARQVTCGARRCQDARQRRRKREAHSEGPSVPRGRDSA